MQETQNNNYNNNKVDIFASLLKQCQSLSHLKQLHTQIIKTQLHQNISLASSLISLYSSTSFTLSHYTHRIFSSIAAPNISLFNHTIRAFSKNPSLSFRPLALGLYIQMIRIEIKPDNYTYPFVLNSCAALSMVKIGVEIHERVIKTGFSRYLPVGNALIDMYGKCGVLEGSYNVFEEMVDRDVVSFNAVLGAFARVGEKMVRARRVFDGMEVRNVISWNAMIVGYINGGDLDEARGVFDVMPERNLVSWMTMLVGYTKNGFVDLARVLFDSMPEKNLVSWTAMITGYAQNRRPNEALGLFRGMPIKPDAVTMTSVISAASQLGGSELANHIGSYVDREGIERNDIVLTALVDMHAKCGNMEEACNVFKEIPQPDVLSYSALITGLASHGHGFKALEVYQEMKVKGIEPDAITFIGVLTACTHTGLIEDGFRFWESMVRDYKIEPKEDHYACMVDMLGRAGRLDEAHKMIKSMPMRPHPSALGALLAACRTYGNIEIAESVAEQLLELEPGNIGNRVLLASIYSSMEQWDKARRVREAMKEKRVNKLPGCSWIENTSHGHPI